MEYSDFFLVILGKKVKDVKLKYARSGNLGAEPRACDGELKGALKPLGTGVRGVCHLGFVGVHIVNLVRGQVL